MGRKTHSTPGNSVKKNKRPRSSPGAKSPGATCTQPQKKSRPDEEGDFTEEAIATGGSLSEELIDRLEVSIQNDLIDAADVDEIRDIVSKHVRSAFQSLEHKLKDWVSTQLEIFRGDVFDVGKKCEDLEKEVESLKNNDRNILDDFDKLQNNVQKQSADTKEFLEKETEAQQMYTRRDNLRIFGVPEVAPFRTENGILVRENTNKIVLDIFRQKLGIDHLSDRDISRCHRVGERKPGSYRAIIVRFLRHEDKDTVVSARSKLAGTRTVVKEDLTQERLMWIHRLKDAGVNYRDIQTNDGIVTVRVEGAKKFIRSRNDLRVVLSIINAGG